MRPTRSHGNGTVSRAAPFQVDLTNCDREPIHLLGAIQPLGMLIAFTADWHVARVSANFADFAGIAADKVLGLPLKRLFEPRAIERLGSLVSFLTQEDSVERLFDTPLLRGREARFDCSLHRSGPLLVLEAEPARGDPAGDTGNVVRAMLSRLGEGDSDDRFFGEAARIVRGVVGFDRVMVYRFARDGSGHVCAESARPDLVSFLDLHYPASDIPQQARALYCAIRSGSLPTSARPRYRLFPRWTKAARQSTCRWPACAPSHRSTSSI